MTKARKVGDEVADVMRCLREVLRESGVATALALLVSGNRQDVEPASAASAESGEDWHE